MDKRFMKTLKLYIKTSFTLSPIIIFAALAFMVALPIGIAAAPAHIGDKDYPSMIGCSGIGQIGILMMVTMGTISNSRSKFLYSTADAKRLMTIVPVIVTVLMGLIYDAVIVTIGVVRLGNSTAADLMIINAMTTLAVTFAISTNCKKGLGFLSFIGVVGIFCDSIITGISSIGKLNGGFGLSLGQAAAVSAAILAVGIGGLLMILNVWWKKSDRLQRLTNNANIAVPEMFGG